MKFDKALLIITLLIIDGAFSALVFWVITNQGGDNFWGYLTFGLFCFYNVAFVTLICKDNDDIGLF